MILLEKIMADIRANEEAAFGYLTHANATHHRGEILAFVEAIEGIISGRIQRTTQFITRLEELVKKWECEYRGHAGDVTKKQCAKHIRSLIEEVKDD